MKNNYLAKSLPNLLKNYKNDIEKDSFNNFYVTYYDYIRKIAHSITNEYEASKDITQEVFEKIIRLNKNKIPNENITSWLYTITKNTAIDYIRKNTKITKVKLTENIYDSECNHEEKILDKELFVVTISKLNDKEKKILSLKIYGNFTFKEISYLLGYPTSKVRYTYYKAINILRPIIII